MLVVASAVAQQNNVICIYQLINQSWTADGSKANKLNYSACNSYIQRQQTVHLTAHSNTYIWHNELIWSTLICCFWFFVPEYVANNMLVTIHAEYLISIHVDMCKVKSLIASE